MACPSGPHYTPQGYPCCNPTLDAAVYEALAKDDKKIRRGYRYLRANKLLSDEEWNWVRANYPNIIEEEDESESY